MTTRSHASFVLFALGVSCTRLTPATTSPSSPASVARRPPPLALAVPMAGEPDANALGEVRLVPAACADLTTGSKSQRQAAITKMRAELQQEFMRWKEAQKDCRAR